MFFGMLGCLRLHRAAVSRSHSQPVAARSHNVPPTARQLPRHHGSGSEGFEWDLEQLENGDLM